MIASRLDRLSAAVRRWFPERQLYVRTDGEMHGITLTTGRQLVAVGVAASVVSWAVLATLGAAGGAVALSGAEIAQLRTEVHYKQMVAERQARLNKAEAQLQRTRGYVDELADTVESRHRALTGVVTELSDAPGAAAALTAAPIAAKAGATSVERIRTVALNQEAMVERADAFAERRAERLRSAVRMAGVNPNRPAADGRGGPLVKVSSHALAPSSLDGDFGARLAKLWRTLSEVESLEATADTLPLARPASGARLTSSFGYRRDPFNNSSAFHSGQDFAGAYQSPVKATAAGVVSFTGVRSGYGNTVEVDHGRGIKTRYAHLARIGVRPGARVELGQTLGGMGSTGRSTGTHLHYEVWVNGQAQNPARYLRAGDHVHAAG